MSCAADRQRVPVHGANPCEQPAAKVLVVAGGGAGGAGWGGGGGAGIVMFRNLYAGGGGSPNDSGKLFGRLNGAP